jgi:hypothetical protein
MPDPEPTPPTGDPEPKPDPSGEPDWKAEAEKWKKFARQHEATAKSNADAAKRLADMEEANKTEAQKLADKAAAAEKKASEAELKALRLEVAGEKGLTPAQAKRLIGGSREELEADADELIKTFGKTEDKPTGGPSGRPKERLRGGNDPTDHDDDERDPRKLAARVPRR